MDNDRRNHLLTVSARAAYANLTITMVALGIHLFMAIYGVSVFLETPIGQRRGRKRYITASIVITILAALTASHDMANYFQVLFKAISPRDWQQQLQVYGRDWKYLLSNACVGLIIIIGDALLVYRCYIVCVDYWWVAILPMVTSLSALVLFFVSMWLDIQLKDYSSHAVASTLLTVSTNIIVTCCITFRLLVARRTVASLMPSADARLYTGVIAILIESAAPLTIFGIIVGILQQIRHAPFLQSPGWIVCRYLFECLFYSFCALSPHMIIFQVTTGRSFTKFPTTKEGGLTQSLQFANQTAEASFLQSTFNRELGGSCEPNFKQGNTSDDRSSEAELAVTITHEPKNENRDIEKAS